MPYLTHTQWSGRTDGTPWMQRSLISLYRVLPLWALYAVMAWVVPFYMLFNREGYRSIYQLFRQRLGHSPVRSFLLTYCNHFRFGQVVLDRFAVFAGKRFKVDVDGMDHFDRLAHTESGFVILSSHVGCYEVAGYTLTSHDKPFNALVFGGETSTVSEQRSRVLSGHNISTIQVSPDMSHIFALNAALDRHEIVSLPADRLFGSRKTALCSFLGAPAPFPVGAYALARAKSVPLLAIFAVKTRLRHYHIIVRPCSDVGQYAAQLEAVVRQYPTQWFNFYDFWSTQGMKDDMGSKK